MLDKLLRELGWYRRPNKYVNQIKVGKFTIDGGNITPSDFLKENDYYRIIGSRFNDGLYQYPNYVLTDEEFDGAVWVMRIPPAVIALAQDIEKYEQSDAGKPSPFSSESFGGYSYTKFTDGNGGDGSRWQKVFASRLNKWRKL